MWSVDWVTKGLGCKNSILCSLFIGGYICLFLSRLVLKGTKGGNRGTKMQQNWNWHVAVTRLLALVKSALLYFHYNNVYSLSQIQYFFWWSYSWIGASIKTSSNFKDETAGLETDAVPGTVKILFPRTKYTRLRIISSEGHLLWSSADRGPEWVHGYWGGWSSRSEALTDWCSIRASPAPPAVITLNAVRATFLPRGSAEKDMLAWKEKRWNIRLIRSSLLVVGCCRCNDFE